MRTDAKTIYLMSHEELIGLIRDSVLRNAGREIVCPLRVDDAPGGGYIISFGIRQYDPLFLTVEGDDGRVREWVERELPRHGMLRDTRYVRIVRNMTECDEPRIPVGNNSYYVTRE